MIGETLKIILVKRTMLEILTLVETETLRNAIGNVVPLGNKSRLLHKLDRGTCLSPD